jgi:hypothetical protein
LTKKDVRFGDFLAAEKVMVDSFGWKLDGENARVSARLRFRILQAGHRGVLRRFFQPCISELAGPSRRFVEQCTGAGSGCGDGATKGILGAVRCQQERALGGQRCMVRLIVGALFG